MGALNDSLTFIYVLFPFQLLIMFYLMFWWGRFLWFRGFQFQPFPIHLKMRTRNLTNQPPSCWESLWTRHVPISVLGQPFGIAPWTCEETTGFCIPSSGMAVSCWAGGNPIVSSNCWTRSVPDISAGLAPPGWRAPNWRKAAAKHPADPGPLLRMASPQCLPRPPRPRAGPGIRSSGSIGIGWSASRDEHVERFQGAILQRAPPSTAQGFPWIRGWVRRQIQRCGRLYSVRRCFSFLGGKL